MTDEHDSNENETEEPSSFFERVVTDDVKRRMIETAYMTCEDIENLDQEQVGLLLGGILGYGVYLGLALAREEVNPPEHEISAFLVMNPEIISAVENAKRDS